MLNPDTLDCKIFVDAQMDLPEVGRIVSAAVSGKASHGLRSIMVSNPTCDIDVRRNPDAIDSTAREETDGFLHYKYVLEYYPSRSADRVTMIELVCKSLNKLWESGIPAVAACDYEESLPSRGGFNADELPWKSRGTVVSRNGAPESQRSAIPQATDV